MEGCDCYWENNGIGSFFRINQEQDSGIFTGRHIREYLGKDTGRGKRNTDMSGWAYARMRVIEYNSRKSG